MASSLTKKSKYFSSLSTESKVRYQSKIAATGLTVDPYTIEEAEWTREPDTIPQLLWSDLMLYMASPHTKEAIKVSLMIILGYEDILINLLRHGRGY